jgi:hypothetical protein
MPTGKQAHKFLERLVALETKVKDLIWYQRWQMGLLAAIFVTVLAAWKTR